MASTWELLHTKGGAELALLDLEELKLAARIIVGVCGINGPQHSAWTRHNSTAVRVCQAYARGYDATR